MPQQPEAAPLPRWDQIYGISRQAARVVQAVSPLAQLPEFPWHKFLRRPKRERETRERDEEERENENPNKLQCYE